MKTFIVKLLAWIYRLITYREIDTFNPDDFEETDSDETNERKEAK